VTGYGIGRYPIMLFNAPLENCPKMQQYKRPDPNKCMPIAEQIAIKIAVDLKKAPHLAEYVHREETHMVRFTHPQPSTSTGWPESKPAQFHIHLEETGDPKLAKFKLTRSVKKGSSRTAYKIMEGKVWKGGEISWKLRRTPLEDENHQNVISLVLEQLVKAASKRK